MIERVEGNDFLSIEFSKWMESPETIWPQLIFGVSLMGGESCAIPY